MSTPTIATCSACGAELHRKTGFCSRCLLEQGLALNSDIETAPSGPFPREFGDYELIEEISRGGIGIVYKARQKSLDRIVAVKTLLFGANADPEMVKRFRSEATVAASLQHSNIVAIHEVGVQRGEPYLAMDLVDGPNLSQYVKAGPLSPKHAAAYVKATAEAIHYAHERGILHRDLKPSNVLIDSNNQPRVTDFGLAKRLTGDAGVTISSHILGSPSYMPPEQATANRGKVGRQSDVYSLGAMLYHLLTARPPFVGESLTDTLEQVLNRDPVPPRILNPAVPADLNAICLKCVEKEPTRRYQTALALSDELDRFLRDEPTLTRPVGAIGKGARWCRRKPALAATLALLFTVALIGFAGILWQWRRAEQHASNEAIQRARAETEAKLARLNSYAADMQVAQLAVEQGDLARAREFLARYQPTPTEEDLRGFEWRYLWNRCAGDQTETLPITAQGYDSLRFLAASSDGRWLAAGADVMDLTSKVRQLALQLGPGEAALAFKPESYVLIISSPDGLKRHDLATGQKEILNAQEKDISALAFSPSGKWLAAGTEQSLTLYETANWNIVARRSDLYFKHLFAAKALAFSPNDTQLITAAGDPRADASELQACSVPSLQSIHFPANNLKDITSIVFSSDGQEFVTGSFDGTVRVWNSATRQELPLRRSVYHHRSFIGDIAFIPDTTQLVSAGFDRCLRVWEVQSTELPTTLRGHTNEIRAMTLTADGTVFSASSEGVINRWASSLFRQPLGLSGSGMNSVPVGLSANGQIAVTLNEGQLRFWDLTKREHPENPAWRWPFKQTALIDADRKSMALTISPDLNWLAFVFSNQPAQLWNRQQRSMTELSSPMRRFAFATFSPDSKWLALPDSEKVEVWDTGKRDKPFASIDAPGSREQVVSFAVNTPLLGIGLPNAVVLWDLRKNERVKSLDIEVELSMALSPDAQMIATGSKDGRIHIHHVSSGAELAVLAGHFSGIERVCFSPDGRTLATASRQWVKFWNTVTWREVASHSQPGRVLVLNFSPDGSTLLTSDGAGRWMQIWRAPFDGLR